MAAIRSGAGPSSDRRPGRKQGGVLASWSPSDRDRRDPREVLKTSARPEGEGERARGRRERDVVKGERRGARLPNLPAIEEASGSNNIRCPPTWAPYRLAAQW